jgi:Copper type II ascorbate-dependent monooxygenase, C-terminal domain/Copper type II ascorbate-dependent monooxygenase, N-terminal domain
MQRIPTGLLVAVCAGGLVFGACAPESPPAAPIPPGSTGATGSGGSTGSPGPGGSGGAGGSAAASADVAGATGQMPCDVASVVRTRCAGCHQTPPLFGAPMPLLNIDHFQQAAKNSQKIWEVARMRVEVGTMPPSSAPQLSVAEKTALLAWLGQGAPAVTGSNCPALPPPSAPIAEPQLGCPPTHTFLSRGSNAAEGFSVPAQLNHYQCFNLPVPFEAQEQATEWAPVIGDARVVHHWILYAVKGTSDNCGQLKRFVVGWAPGGSTQKTPPDIGLELPNSDERLLLEVHYNNPTMLTGIKDRTGVAMCTTKTPRPVEAGVITFGTTSIRIPGRARDLEIKGTCDSLQTRLFSQPVHLLSSFPHMHTRGVRFSTWINRGAAGVPVVEVKSWDFNHQAAYPHDHANLVINPGESLTTTCVYTNPTDREIRFGENTEDEMCFNFATVYPISAVRALSSRPLRLCSGF